MKIVLFIKLYQVKRLGITETMKVQSVDANCIKKITCLKEWDLSGLTQV